MIFEREMNVWYQRKKIFSDKLSKISQKCKTPHKLINSTETQVNQIMNNDQEAEFVLFKPGKFSLQKRVTNYSDTMHVWMDKSIANESSSKLINYSIKN